MTTPKKINKLYIITRDANGKLHHFVSATAMMHMEVVSEFDIDLDKHELVEKGFVHDGHSYTANFDIRGETVRKAHERRREGEKR